MVSVARFEKVSIIASSNDSKYIHLEGSEKGFGDSVVGD